MGVNRVQLTLKSFSEQLNKFNKDNISIDSGRRFTIKVPNEAEDGEINRSFTMSELIDEYVKFIPSEEEKKAYLDLSERITAIDDLANQKLNEEGTLLDKISHFFRQFFGGTTNPKVYTNRLEVIKKFYEVLPDYKKGDADARSNVYNHIRRAAWTGIPEAIYEVGMNFLNSDKPNEKRAINWLTKAARLGHSDAQYELGKLLLKNIEITKDNWENLKDGMNWLCEAANKSNHPEAQYQLAIICRDLYNDGDFRKEVFDEADKALTSIYNRDKEAFKLQNVLLRTYYCAVIDHSQRTEEEKKNLKAEFMN